MNLEQYEINAARTFVSIDHEKDIYHIESGMITELGEFTDIFKRELAYNKPIDKVNLSEEWADFMWYAVRFGKLLGLDFTVNPEFVHELAEGGLKNAGNLQIANVIGFSPLVTDAILEKSQFHYNFMLSVWYALAEIFEIDTEKALENNINKLKVRYPEKFTNENALNRNIEAERAELEK